MQLRRCGPGPTPKARASLLPSVVAPSRSSCTGRVNVSGSRPLAAMSSTRQRRIDPPILAQREPVMVADSDRRRSVHNREGYRPAPRILRKMSSTNLTDVEPAWLGHDALNVSWSHHVVSGPATSQPPARAIQQGHRPGRGTMEGTGVDEPGRTPPDIEGLVGMAGEQVIGPLRLETGQFLARIAVGHREAMAVQLDQSAAFQADPADGSRSPAATRPDRSRNSRTRSSSAAAPARTRPRGS